MTTPPPEADATGAGGSGQATAQGGPGADSPPPPPPPPWQAPAWPAPPPQGSYPASGPYGSYPPPGPYGSYPPPGAVGGYPPPGPYGSYPPPGPVGGSPPPGPYGSYPPPGGYSGYPPPGYGGYGAGGYSSSAYPGFAGFPPSPKTNGFAIASLVVSIAVWGIGSVLGIVFGCVALSTIKKSRGAEKGRGLAIAGISVGAGGLVIGVALAITLIVVFAHFDQVDVVPMGTTVNLTNCGCDSSLSRLTVTGLTEAPASAVTPALPGNRLWVAGIDACEIADPEITDGPQLYDLSVVTADGNLYAPGNEVPRGERNVLNTDLGPLQCVRGYVSFWVPTNETPTGVEYLPNGPFSRYEWKLA